MKLELTPKLKLKKELQLLELREISVAFGYLEVTVGKIDKALDELSTEEN